MLNYYKRYANETKDVLESLPLDIVEQITQCLIEARNDNRFIFVMGNGGSAATASHFANDMGKGELSSSFARFRVFALTDNIPLITAWANDSAYEDIFAEQLHNFVRKRDVVIAISSSGNSPNILKALRLARCNEAVTIGFAGFGGGHMKELLDHCCVVPSTNVQHIEDTHMLLMHMIYSYIRDTDRARL